MGAFFKVMIMAVIQGVTEFLPVSSSGHLALAKHFLRLDSPGATLELFLHGGTLLSVGLFYRRRLWALFMGIFRRERLSVLYALWVLLSMLPAGIVCLFKGDSFEAAYDQPMFVGAMLCVTGVMLIGLRVFPVRVERRMGGWQAIIMGCAQAVAMIPGISRSGSTISSARFMGVSPSEAAEFSFIMSMPVIAGAVFLKLVQTGNLVCEVTLSACLVGAVVSFGVGLGAIHVLVRTLNSGKFWLFGVYCLVAGVFSMVFI